MALGSCADAYRPRIAGAQPAVAYTVAVRAVAGSCGACTHAGALGDTNSYGTVAAVAVGAWADAYWHGIAGGHSAVAGTGAAGVLADAAGRAVVSRLAAERCGHFAVAVDSFRPDSVGAYSAVASGGAVGGWGDAVAIGAEFAWPGAVVVAERWKLGAVAAVAGAWFFGTVDFAFRRDAAMVDAVAVLACAESGGAVAGSSVVVAHATDLDLADAVGATASARSS
ncbi:hypothetical protein ACFVAV_19750 [Nocardia sp. NPDC057663]|uniref:hypothetical protein n=1 Tax=Nocardia sp. NPDC057663 TaxID=3346201 RepID=UPI00366BB6D2